MATPNQETKSFNRLTPKKSHDKNTLYFDEFPQALDDIRNILGDNIKSFKANEQTNSLFVTILRNGKEIRVHRNHPLYNQAKVEELRRLEHLEEFLNVQAITEEANRNEMATQDKATVSLIEQLQKEEEEELK